MKSQPLTQKRLHALLDYDAETGNFYWKHRPAAMFSSCPEYKRWNSRYAGTIAGSPNGNGYIKIRIWNKYHRAHRLAWLYVHGVWPEMQIDHKDGNGQNNSIHNLREATQSQNQQNRTPPKHKSTSKYVGVSRISRSGKWLAQIMVDKKQYRLGSFDDEESAAAAYLAAKRVLHPFQPEPRTGSACA